MDYKNKVKYFDTSFNFDKRPYNRVVFTNGCFDVLHFGHLAILGHSKKLGDFLVVGLNSDISIKKLKGELRPINSEEFRAAILSFFEIVDAIIIFNEETPLELIKALKPDLIVKGGDYTPDEVIGKEILEEYGGEIVIIPTVEGYSSTSIIHKIRNQRE